MELKEAFLHDLLECVSVMTSIQAINRATIAERALCVLDFLVFDYLRNISTVSEFLISEVRRCGLDCNSLSE